MMSGNMAAPIYRFNRHPLDTGQAFAEEFEIRSNDVEDLIADLLEKP